MKEAFIRIAPIEEKEPITKIKVVGVGGGGGNALNHMVEEGVDGVEFIAVNTDSQDLAKSLAGRKVQIGEKLTGGRGTGGQPERGKEAAEESADLLADMVKGANMVFITAGMGGGTGTGAAQIISEVARKADILTVGVVTTPFKVEGSLKMKKAMSGIAALKAHVNSLIIIPNEKLRELGGGKMPLREAFRQADSLLLNAVKGISELIVSPGFMNVDFEDVKTVMNMGGIAIMGMGDGEGEGKALDAVRQAIEHPLLERKNIQGARGILLNFTCGEDTSVDEITSAVEYLTKEASPEAEIKFGLVFDDKYQNKIKVTVVATGFKEDEVRQAEEASLKDPIQPFSEDPMVLDPYSGISTIENRGNTGALNWGNTPKGFEPKGFETRNLEEPTFLRNKV